jgi:hypothetical protein
MSLDQSFVERVEGPFLTEIGEFRYIGTNKPVRREQEYSIYYLKTKTVEYRLNVNDLQISRSKEVMQELYQAVRPEKNRDVYPKQIYKTSKNINFKSNVIKRTFAQNKLEKNPEIIEVEVPTKTNSYKFITINWKVSGSIADVEHYNSKVLQKAEGQMPGISEKLPLTQLHQQKILQFD